jgi:hypothetical protein
MKTTTECRGCNSVKVNVYVLILNLLHFIDLTTHSCINKYYGSRWIVVGKPEGKRPLGRPRRRWDLREIGWGGMDWIDLAQDRDQWKALVNTVMNLRVP